MKKNIKVKNRRRKINRFRAFIRSHRAQIRMSETIAVMFIFFVLVVFGIVFYYKYSQISFKEKQEELMGARAIDITLKSLFLPELICSRGEAEPEDNCFDMMKLRQLIWDEEGVFSNHFEEYYFDLFPYTNIIVERLYPEPYEKWILYEKIKPDWTRKEATHFVVTLKDETKQEEDEYSFGVLTIEVYS